MYVVGRDGRIKELESRLGGCRLGYGVRMGRGRSGVFRGSELSGQMRGADHMIFQFDESMAVGE